MNVRWFALVVAAILARFAVWGVPTVSDLTVTPVAPWGLALDYTVSGATDVETNMPVTVTATADDTNYVARHLSGATNWTNGPHRVYWNMAKDGITATVADSVVRVLYDNYWVIDLSGGANAASYPVSYLSAVPMGGWTDEYKTTKLVLRRIPAGTFIMGEDQSDESHRVTISQPFYVGVFEVTQKQWELVMGSNPSQYKGSTRPVEGVSYYGVRGSSAGAGWPLSSAVDATSFLGKLRAKTGLDGFDLPTEAQWEYVCRAGMISAYNNGGDTEADLQTLGRYSGNTSDGCDGYTGAHTAVGAYAPNGWGLYDMHGNVWEWCLDWHGVLAYGIDPRGSSSGSGRVLRGGGWSSRASNCASFYRDFGIPLDRLYNIGFRLVKTLNNKADCWVGIDPVVAAVGSAAVSNVAWRTHGEGDLIAGSLQIDYVPDVNGRAVVSVDGRTVVDSAMPGTFVWRPQSTGTHSVVHSGWDGAFTATYTKMPDLYRVIDLSGGTSAASYPISYLSAVPAGGWTDEHKTTKLVLRRIPAGTFIMGDDQANASRRVTISQPFYVGVFEVTQKQWELVMGSNPSYYTGDRRPVEQVSYTDIRGSSDGAQWPTSSAVDATSFLGKLRAKTGLDGFDLPTEAQWEYACRAGTTSKYNNGGDTEADLQTLGRYFGNTSDGRGGYTGAHTAVGLYAPNDWGLYDMHGNVYERCLDWWGVLTYGIDPGGLSSGSGRAFRGGDWSGYASFCASFYRDFGLPSDRFYNIGFRLVCLRSDAWDSADDTSSGGTWLFPSVMVQTHAPHDLDADDRYDFFRISMTAGWTYTFETTGDGDTYGELFSSAPTNASYRVASDDDGGDGRNFKLTYTPTMSGTYYLRVRAYTVGASLSYALAYGASNLTFVSGDVTTMGWSGAYDGAAHGISVSVDSGIEGATVAYALAQDGPYSSTLPTRTDAGSQTTWYIVSAPGYVPLTNAATVSISPRTVTFTSGSASKEYDGTALVKHEVSVGGAGFVSDEGASYSFTGSQTAVGTSDNTFTYGLNANTKASNYDVTVDYGTLTVNDRTWTHAVNSDGTATLTGVSSAKGDVAVPGVVDGHRVTTLGESLFSGCTGLTSVTIPSSVTNICTGAFRGCSALAAVDIPAGVSSIGASAFADCTRLATVRFAGDAPADVVKGAFPSNAVLYVRYDSAGWDVMIPGTWHGCPIRYADGYRGFDLRVEGWFGIYDGKPHGVVVTVASGVADVSMKYALSANGPFVSGVRTLTDAGAATVWCEISAPGYDTQTCSAEIAIAPRTVTLTSVSASKEYDGTALVKHEVSVGGVGFVSDEGASYSFTGSQTAVGTSDNTFTYGLNANTKASNYAITVDYGTLTVNDRTWTHAVNSDGTATLTGVSSARGDVAVPGIVDGYHVTALGDALFSGCSGLTSVTIPSSVTSIGAGAFRGCSTLAAVDIPAGVSSIGASAFAGCTRLAAVRFAGDAPADVAKGAFPSNAVLYVRHGSAGWDVMIPGTWHGCPIRYADGYRGFDLRVEGWSGIYDGKPHGITVTVAGGVADVSLKYALSANGPFVSGVRMLTDAGAATVWCEISAPGYDTQTCSAEIAIAPRTVTLTSVSASKEYDGTALVKHEVSVGGAGFVSDEGASYSFTGSQTAVGASDNAFTCELDANTKASNYAITVDYGTLTVNARTWTHAVNSDGTATLTGVSSAKGDVAVPDVVDGHRVTALGVSLFKDFAEMTEVSIPSSVTNIEDHAFAGCSGLDAIVLPSCVTEIGTGAFSGCTGLVSIVLPSCVTSLAESLFSRCTALASISLPSGLMSIGPDAFSGCETLEAINLPAGVSSIGAGAFSGCTGLTSVTIPSNVTALAASLFRGCTGLETVTLRGAVTSIGDRAFGGCARLTAFELPDSLETIGDFAFEGCNGLSAVTIPEGVANIGMSAFAGCGNVQSVVLETIPPGLEAMSPFVPGPKLVDGSNWIEERDLLDGVAVWRSNSIGDYESTELAFDIPAGMEAFVFAWKVESEANYDKLTWYLDGAKQADISGSQDWRTVTNVLDGAVHRVKFVYSKDGSWSTAPDCGWISVRGDTGGGLRGLFPDSYANLTNVVLGANVTTLPAGLFAGCAGLASIAIPSAVTSIGDSAFAGCTGIRDFVLPARVERIGAEAFRGCSALTSVTIPSSVTSIAASLFRGCTGLEAVTLRGAVTSIGERAFAGCTRLAVVNFAGNAPADVGEDAFLASTVLYVRHGSEGWGVMIPGTWHGCPIRYADGYRGFDLRVEGWSGIYDGKPHGITVTVAGGVADVSLKYALSANGPFVFDVRTLTDAGAATVWCEISAPGYDSQTCSAEIAIAPRTVTLTSANASKEYDGTALVKHGCCAAWSTAIRRLATVSRGRQP